MSASRPHRGADVARAIAALLVLTALLVGLPAGLVAFSGRLWPAHLGFSASAVGHALTSPDSGRLFLRALAVVGWIGWAGFAVSVVVEIPARLRRRPAPRLRGLFWCQGLATGLVAAVTVLVSTPGAGLASGHGGTPGPVAAMSAVAAVSPVSASPQAMPTHSAQSAGAAQSTRAAQIAQVAHQAALTRDYVVQPGDSLWQISERVLGSGEQYHRIAELNAGRLMPDGEAFRADAFLQPGWTLRVPADSTVTVQPGDSLSKIAEHEYGDADQWPQIFTANEGAEQNGGRFTDPNLIYPGERLTIPDPTQHTNTPATGPSSRPPQAAVPAPQAEAAHGIAPEAPRPPIDPPIQPGPPIHTVSPVAASPVTAPPATASPNAKAPGPIGADVPTAELPTVDVPIAELPTADVPTVGLPTAGLPTRPDDPPADPAASISPAVTALSHPTPTFAEAPEVLTVLGLSGLSAAAFLILLEEYRRRQQTTRRVGQRIALPGPATAAAERGLRAIASPAGREFLDRALRTLARHAAATGQLIPEIRAALVRPAGVELRLSRPHPPIAPFTAPGGAVWWCPRGDAALLPRGVAKDQPVPYPALVLTATAEDGTAVFLDLEYYGVLEIGGDPAQVEAVIRALGVELPWSDHVSVAPAGIALAPELARAAPRPEPADRVLPAFEQWADAVSAVLPPGAGTDPLRAARIGQTRPDATPPRIVVAAAEWAGPQVVARLRASVGQEPRPSAAAVVGVGPSVPPGPHRITVAADGKALLTDLQIPVTMHRIEENQYARLVDIMAPTRLPAVDDPSWPASVAAFRRSGLRRAVTAAADPAADPAFIRILGPVEAAGAAPITDPHLLETAAYLRLNPGTDIRTLGIDLGVPTHVAGARLAQLRTLLGTDPTGAELLPLATPDGRLALAESVGCDWLRFEEHRRAGRFAEALVQVRGEPFADVRPGRFAWAEPLRQTMIATVVDVAHTLGQAHLDEGDFPAARHALTGGLTAVPYAEPLYQGLMLVAAAEAGPDTAEEIGVLIEDFTTMCEEYGINPSPETVRAMTRLAGLVRRRPLPPGLSAVS